MLKAPIVHPKFGPRLVAEKRHHHRPMTEERKSDRDPNDTVKITFTVKDESMEPWFDKRIADLKEYDAGFYCQINSWLHGVLYTLTTTQRHLEHEDFKKFMFQVKLKLGEDVKIR